MSVDEFAHLCGEVKNKEAIWDFLSFLIEQESEGKKKPSL